MKPKVFNALWLVALIFCLPVTGFSAEPANQLRRTEFKKKVEKEFSVGLNDDFKVTNKYGKIDITTWDVPQVKVEVTITVNSSSQEKANEAFDRIKINFDQGTGYTSAMTEIGDKKSSWSSWWGSSNSDNFSIDYAISMPAGHNLELSNKYGHSHVASFNGKGKFSVKYGDLFTQNVGGSVDLYLGYGNATMGTSKDVNAEIKYSKLRMDDIGNCTLTSKYSKIYLNAVKDFKIYSGYDDFEVASAENVDFEIKYTDMDIMELRSVQGISKYSGIYVKSCEKKARLELNYGSVKIDEVKPGFELIDIKTNYAGVKMHVHPDASYDFSASTRYAGIDYPSGMDISRDIQSGSSKEISGKHGSGNGGSIKIATNYGGIKVW